jgi:hypothetical protein
VQRHQNSISIPEEFRPSDEYETTITDTTIFKVLIDLCGDRKVQEIESLEISVDKLLDYRKLGTAIPLLSRFSLRIDQTATIQTGDDQFVRLEYQRQVRGFQSFFNNSIALKLKLR